MSQCDLSLMIQAVPQVGAGSFVVTTTKTATTKKTLA